MKPKDLSVGPGPDGGVLIRFTAEDGTPIDVSLSAELTGQLAATLMHAATQIKELRPLLQMFQIDQIEAGLLDGVPTLSYVAGPGHSVTVSITESDARQVMETWGKSDPVAQAATRSLQ